MSTVIAGITFRGMLGRRRALLLLLLPASLLALAGVLIAADAADTATTTELMQLFAIGTLLPLVALIAGTGVIGPEIDDGEIMYLLTKPIARPVISTTKLAVAIVLVVGFGAVPTLVAGLLLTGTEQGLAVAFGVGALVGGIAYCALFVALAVVSRFAVTIGLIYALVWESLLGNFVPGARTLSVQQWALSVADTLTGASALDAEVSPGVAVALLIAVTVAGVAIAGWRLRSIPIAGTEA